LPYVARPKHPRGRLVAVVAATVITLFGVPAAAQAACPSAATAKAFKGFGDTADYSLLSNGAFESGTGGWSLSGASVVSGNESFKVRGSTDAKSLAIGARGRVVSPAFCVSTDHPSFRFFAKRTSGTWGVLNVSLRWKVDGTTNETVVGSVTTGSAWTPTQSFSLSQILGLWNGNQVGTAQIVLDPEDYGGDWAIDDVYIDPYTRG
jgi:pectate lyase